MHLTEESYQRLVAGEEFPGSDELAAHLESPCAACEAFLSERRPEGLLPAGRPPATSGNELRSRAGRLSRTMRTENLAVVLTDIQGFTERTSRQTRAETERLLSIHEALLMPVFRAFAGVVRKSIGDAYLVTFESPTNAVLCGAAIQDRLFSFNQTAPEPDRLHVRVVANVGEVRVEASDVFGEPMMVAKALEEVAQAGEVTFTEAVYLVMNKAEVPSVDLGLTGLKGVPEQVRLFKVPRGPYRLGAAPTQAETAASQLPFGGLGLMRAGNLPSADLDSIQRTILNRQNRRAAAAKLLGTLRESGAGKVALAGVAALALALVGWGVHRAMRPPIERALEAGQLGEVRRLVEAMPRGAERTYYSARLEEKEHDLRDAIDDYVDAARASPEWVKRAVDGLGNVARMGDCGTKARVADALGDLGEGYGRGLLEELTQEKPVKATGLGGLIGQSCDPAAHASRALERLGDR